QGGRDGARVARGYERRAASGRERAWVRWLGRPAALATSVALLIACAWAGDAWLSSAPGTGAQETSLVSAMLGEDGSFGLIGDVGDGDEAGGPSSPDSGEVAG